MSPVLIGQESFYWRIGFVLAENVATLDLFLWQSSLIIVVPKKWKIRNLFMCDSEY